MSSASSLPADYFALFGVERTLRIDESALQRKFYDLSRQYHPDRFAGRPPLEQQFALDFTSMLNDAWRVLRNPVKRAEYLLKQEGFDVGEQRSKDVPAELLEEVFELNMALEEMRSGDETARPQLEDAGVRFAKMQHEVDAQLDAEFARYDSSRGHDVLTAVRGLLNRRRYIQNLVHEVERALAGEPPALTH